VIRKIVEDDRTSILRLLDDITIFTAEERVVAMELVDEALERGDRSGYLIYCSPAEGGEIDGYICFGPIAMTDGRYDLYWIAVHSHCMRNGLGTELMKHMERTVHRWKGKSIFIETSSTPNYRPARRLYDSLGYRIAARVPDFYREKDDKLIYTKKVSRQ